MHTAGVVFDFNGTLFWDTAYQDYSWDKFFEKYHVTMTEAERAEYIHGRNAKDTFEYFFKRAFTEREIDELIEEKEVIYRAACLKSAMTLAPGAAELLRYLKARDIPIAIATASGKNNVDFFIEHLDLLKYFRRERIIYNDGSFKGKPDPDMFLAAIKKLRVENEYVTIFEDSLSGIEAAKRSGVKHIVLVDPDKKKDLDGVIRIGSFHEFDRNVL